MIGDADSLPEVTNYPDDELSMQAPQTEDPMVDAAYEAGETELTPPSLF